MIFPSPKSRQGKAKAMKDLLYNHRDTFRVSRIYPDIFCSVNAVVSQQQLRKVKRRRKEKLKAAQIKLDVTTAISMPSIDPLPGPAAPKVGKTFRQRAKLESKARKKARQLNNSNEKSNDDGSTFPSAWADSSQIQKDLEVLPKEKQDKKRKMKEGFLQKAEKRLKGSRFRILNEKLYTACSEAAVQLFQADPAAFEEYHEGYREQMADWPENPNLVIAKWLQKK